MLYPWETCLDFALLEDRPEAIQQIAEWHFRQWGWKVPGETVDSVRTKLQGYLNRHCIPLAVLAITNDEIVGTASLKYREMDIYPDKEHWLGGVFVSAEHRGKGVATRLVSKSLEMARALGVKVLHLQTEQMDGGLYAKLGWKPLEQIQYKGQQVLVMHREVEA